jgi:hypothetical protein
MTAQSVLLAASFAFGLVTLGASPALAQGQVGSALPGMSAGTSPTAAPTASVPRAGPLTSPLSGIHSAPIPQSTAMPAPAAAMAAPAAAAAPTR